jgi:hypothetical protein
LTAAGHVPKAKPDPMPMRLALGAAGLASLSALVAAIVLPPRPVVLPPADLQGAANSTSVAPTTVQQPIQYVQLQPGQTAPPGAKVVDPAAPQPITVVTTAAPVVQKPVIIKTTQSGKVIP